MVSAETAAGTLGRAVSPGGTSGMRGGSARIGAGESAEALHGNSKARSKIKPTGLSRARVFIRIDCIIIDQERTDVCDQDGF